MRDARRHRRWPTTPTTTRCSSPAGIGVPGDAAVLRHLRVGRRAVVPDRVPALQTTRTRIVLAAFWAASVGYLVQLLFGLSVTGTTFLLWIALGAGAGADGAARRGAGRRRWGTAAAVVILAACALGIGYQGVQLLADNAYLQAQTSTVASRTAPRRRQERYGSTRSTRSTRALSASPIATRSGLPEAGRQGAAERRGHDAVRRRREATVSPNAEAAFKDAIAFVPDEYDNYVSLADLYNIGGAGSRREPVPRAPSRSRNRDSRSSRSAPPSASSSPEHFSAQGKTAEAVRGPRVLRRASTPRASTRCSCSATCTSCKARSPRRSPSSRRSMRWRPGSRTSPAHPGARGERDGQRRSVALPAPDAADAGGGRT